MVIFKHFCAAYRYIIHDFRVKVNDCFYCGGWMRDCIYIFGVIQGWIRRGFRGKYGEDYVMRGCGRWIVGRFECGELGWLGRFGEIEG